MPSPASTSDKDTLPSRETICDSLPGYLREICLGTANPKAPHTREAYLVQFGKAGLLNAADVDFLLKHRARTSASQERARENAPKPAKVQKQRGPCAHFGPVVSSIGCQSCGGTVVVQIHECHGPHGECVLGASREGIHGCKGCGDWKESQGDA
jgi:hypothetical protein